MTLTILPNNTNSDMIELTTSDSRGRRTLWAVAHADMFGDAQAISRRLYTTRTVPRSRIARSPSMSGWITKRLESFVQS